MLETTAIVAQALLSSSLGASELIVGLLVGAGFLVSGVRGRAHEDPRAIPVRTSRRT